MMCQAPAPLTPPASPPPPTPRALATRAPGAQATPGETLDRGLTSCNVLCCSDRKDFTNDIKTDFNIDDLNFDPAAIIGENNGDWNVSHSLYDTSLDKLYVVVFQLNNMDPNDLLSFLDGPGDLATPPSSGAGSEGGRAGGAASQEDLLSLFD